MVLQLPEGEVAEELTAIHCYPVNKLGPAAEYRVIQYQVMLTVEQDGLLGQVVVIPADGSKPKVKITEARVTFRSIGMSLTDL